MALGLPRSSYYYQPRGESAENLRLLRLLDEEYTRLCFLGARSARPGTVALTGVDAVRRRAPRRARTGEHLIVLARQIGPVLTRPIASGDSVIA